MGHDPEGPPAAPGAGWGSAGHDDAFAGPDGDLVTAPSVGLLALRGPRDRDAALPAGGRRHEVGAVVLTGDGGAPFEVGADDLSAVLAEARRRL